MGKLRTLEVENVEDLFLNQMFYRRLFWLCWDRDIDSVWTSDCARQVSFSSKVTSLEFKETSSFYSEEGKEAMCSHEEPPERFVWGQDSKWHYSKKP